MAVVQKFSLFGLIVLFVANSIAGVDDIPAWKYLDFDYAMQITNYPNVLINNKRYTGYDGVELYALFKTLYEKNAIKSDVQDFVEDKEPRIPKIIHQVWIGSPVPEELKQYIISWVQKHLGRGWQYKLWTDKEIKQLHLYNQDIYDSCTNYGQKADIVRYEILYLFGGVTIDTDFECLKEFDILHDTYDFYVGIQPLDSQLLMLGNGLVGAAPKHPILKHCLLNLRESCNTYKGVMLKTGPHHLTRAFLACAGKFGTIDIALPVAYCYPLYTREVIRDPSIRNDWLKKGSFAVHHWAMSWMPAEKRRKEFRGVSGKGTEAWNDK